MRKNSKLTCLFDSDGVVWVYSMLTPAQVKRLIKEYSRYSVELMERVA